MNPLYSILGNPENFLNDIFVNLEKTGIDVSEYELDHICYRTETQNEYDNLKNQISKYAKLLIENIIGGRYISTYKFIVPFEYKNKTIRILELPAPKIGSFYKSGYEHVEFATGITPQDFIKKYSKISFDIRAIHKEVNNDVSLNFGDISVKFHQFPLDYVIENFEK